MSFAIDRVMAALDGSVRAPGVFRVARGIAESFGAKLYVFRAIAVPPDFPAAAANPPDLVPALMEREALDDLAALTRDTSVEATVVTQSHQPWRAILDEAGRLNVDLIVMGSHGYHGIDRLLGTTAGKVANQATRNVLIVHERGEIKQPG
jgi:nucleotide-binding universal stress UspA family protein